MIRLGALLRAALGAPSRWEAPAPDLLVETVEELRRELARLQEDVEALERHLATLRSGADALQARERTRIDEQASLAAVPHARLRSATLSLEGPPARRAGVRRHGLGAPVALPVRPWIGVETCATGTAEIRRLWQALLASEAACPEGVLAGEAGTVLELADATVSKSDMLHVSLDPTAGAAAVEVCAIPRFAYEFPPRKLRNFGHWLLDCVPQVRALMEMAPNAVFLLPEPYRDVHWMVLEVAGVGRERVRVWDGTPVACHRLLVQESDGRIARGRPLAPLLDLRRRVAGTSRPGRRVYVSRRDAKPHRQWLVNHDAVEALFRDRGFEILVMRECPLDEQVHLMREAAVVAGVSGAGLAGIVFSPPGTHVITLLTDSLMRWYAEEWGSRSAWARGAVPVNGSLNELSDSPRFYAYLAAAFEQPAHTFVGEDVLPPGPLSAFLDNVLGRVAGA